MTIYNSSSTHISRPCPFRSYHSLAQRTKFTGSDSCRTSLHDTPELFIGDLPSLLKRHIEQISGENNPIEAIEAEIAPWLVKMKNEIRGQYPEQLVE